MSKGLPIQDRVIFIEGVPSSNPPDGHRFLYIDPSDGVLKTLDSLGNKTSYFSEDNHDGEIGTWTPQNSNISITAEGIYELNYNTVRASFYITIPTNSNSSNAGFTGLPFASHSVGNVYDIGIISKPDLQCIALQGNQTLNIQDKNSGTTISLSDLSDQSIRGQITYRRL